MMYRKIIIILIAYRAWQRKLHAFVANDMHKAEIYKCLWTMMSEVDPGAFDTKMEAFLKFWESKEAKFIAYFRSHYLERKS